MALLSSPLWLLLALSLSSAHSSTTPPQQSATYIVHMDMSAMPSNFSSHRNWFSAALAAAVGPLEPSSIIYVYNHAMHGFSARLTRRQLDRLKNTSGFLLCYRDERLVKPDTTHTPEFLHLSPDSGLWPAAGYGNDIIVGMVDSGIWPESRSFKDDGLSAVPARWKGACESGTDFDPRSACNRKLIGARKFNKGLLALLPPNTTFAVNSPRDTEGHGTHTASTAAGSPVPGASFYGYARGVARGMAPRARLAVYKVFWEYGATTSDIIAAIDRAITDGVDILSLSFGFTGTPLYRDPVAIATFAAMERGIFVSTSAGNEGPDLGFLHNGTPWVLTVAAGTVDRRFAGIVKLGDGRSIIGESIYPGQPVELEKLPLVFMGKCDNFTGLTTVVHKMVVCDAVNGYLDLALYEVEFAGVTAALFISNSPFPELYEPFSFPGAILSPQDGSIVLEYINTTRSLEPTASLRFRETILGTKPAPKAAAYSSRGPSRACPSVSKPDVLAPGSLILASWSQNSSVAVVGSQLLFAPFNIISGTSMACPHGSGMAALLKAVHPGWSPAAIRSALMTTATPFDNTVQPIQDAGHKDRPATPLAIGSGLIQPNKALDPGLVYDAGPDDYINLLCAMNYTVKQIKAITRRSQIDCSNGSLDLNYPSFIAFFDGGNKSSEGVIRSFRRTVTNVGDGEATYCARVEELNGFSLIVEPEKLVFGKKYEKKSFTLVLEGHLEEEEEKKNQVAHGALTWVEAEGRYEVRSPVVATTFSSARL